VDDRGDDRGPRRGELHVCAARQHEREDGELQDGDGDDREVRFFRFRQTPDDEQKCVAGDLEREVAAERLAAEGDEREREKCDGEQRDGHRSNASTCRIVWAAKCGSTLMRIVRAAGGSSKRTAPSTHAAWPEARMGAA